MVHFIQERENNQIVITNAQKILTALLQHSVIQLHALCSKMFKRILEWSARKNVLLDL